MSLPDYEDLTGGGMLGGIIIVIVVGAIWHGFLFIKNLFRKR